MASLDTLPSDQRAVLELVLRRGRSYDEIAGMLSIDRAGVRSRALAALDALGPQSAVSAERRSLITDYLLGALPDRVAEQVREMLAANSAERAWARVVASELAPISSAPLPDIPSATGERKRESERKREPERKRPPERPRERDRPARARSASPPPRRAPGARSRPSSRRGGAVILVGGTVLVVAVVVVLILALSGGSSKPPLSAARGASTGATGATSSTGATGTTTAGGAQAVAQINLDPPSGGRAKGVAEVLRRGSQTAVAIVAQGLVANATHPPNAYAVWLYNSPTDSHILGFVSPGVGKTGNLQTQGPWPSNASRYQKLLVTLETQSNPKSPGAIVLEGTIPVLR